MAPNFHINKLHLTLELHYSPLQILAWGISILCRSDCSLFGEKILIFTSHFRLFSTYVLIYYHDYPSQIELRMHLNHHRHFRKFSFEFVRTPWLCGQPN